MKLLLKIVIWLFASILFYFAGLKKITGKNYVERAVIKAIKNDIAIYAVHTALDNHKDGVNKIFCDALGIENIKSIDSKTKLYSKISHLYDF